MHPDEANQAVRAGILQSSGAYDYDPAEHHGPTLYYLAMPGAWLTSGRNFADTTEATFRAVPALFGAGSILLLLLVRGSLGRGPVLVSALLTAVSPAMVYFSRFYIQEMLLVFFTLGLIASLWRYLQRPGSGWAALAGFFAAMMFATKETCVLSWSALAAAAAGTAWLCPGWRARCRRGGISGMHLLVALLAGAVVTAAFFSSFFTHWEGLGEAVTAYATYARRAAGGSGHDHPWHFYLHRLGWFRAGRGPLFSEGLILVLALAGAAAAWTRRRESEPSTVLPLLLTFYTLFLTALYSVIPYKTPWCALSFLHGMILLAGTGAAALVRAARTRPLQIPLLFILAACLVQLGGQSWMANSRFSADPRNPWCYAQTSTDLLNLARRVEDLAAVHPSRESLTIAVVESPENVWPLPWYLRKYPNTGYWPPTDELPGELAPDIVVSGPGQATPLDGQSQCEYYGLRPQVLLALHIRSDLWERFLAERR